MKKKVGEFRSSHFDEKNILVHIRHNTRTDADGNKVLFLEEVQSDWGQTGKKEGFENPAYSVKLSDKEIDGLKLYDILMDGKPLADIDTRDLAKWYENKYREKLYPRNASENQANKVAERLNEALTEGKVPSAPFVTDTNAWTKLGLKVALKEAVKQGATKIAWTTGTQQFDRWGSEEIHWNTVMKPKGFEIVVKDDAKRPLVRGSRIKSLSSNDGSQNQQAEVKRLAEKWNLKPEDLEVIPSKGQWTLAINEQTDAQAFQGNEEALRSNKLEESDISVGTKAELRDAIKRNLARERNDAEIDKLTDRIWNRMQTEDSGTSLPRKEGMEEFYGNPKDMERAKGFTIKKEGELFAVKDEKGKTIRTFKQENEANKFKENYGLGIVGNVAKSLFKQEPKTVSIDANERGKSTKDFDDLKQSLQFEKQLADKGKTGIVSTVNKDGSYTIEWNENKPSTQHSIDITPELKAQVSEGLPMFMVRQNETEVTKSEIENAISSLDVAVSDYANDDSIDNYLGLNDAFETLAYTSIGDAQSMAKELGAKYPELKDDFDSILNEASKPKVESKKVSNESDAIRTLISEDVDGRLYPTIVDSLGKFANQITAETTGNVQEREVSGEYVRLTLQNMKDIATQKMLQLQEVLGEDWVEKSISFFEREPYSGNPAIIIGLSNIISTDIQNKIQSTTDIKELDSLVALQNRMDRVVNRNGRVASLALNYRRIFTSFAQGDSVTDAMAGNNLTEEAKKQIEVVKKALVEQPTDEQLNSVGNVVPPSSQKTKGAKSSRKTQTDSVLKAQIKNNAINSLTEVDANGKKSTKTWQDAVREANEESKKHKC
jgi:hypothetical protein